MCVCVCVCDCSLQIGASGCTYFCCSCGWILTCDSHLKVFGFVLLYNVFGFNCTSVWFFDVVTPSRLRYPEESTD